MLIVICSGGGAIAAVAQVEHDLRKRGWPRLEWQASPSLIQVAEIQVAEMCWVVWRRLAVHPQIVRLQQLDRPP
jgi:hypothetical protein